MKRYPEHFTSIPNEVQQFSLGKWKRGTLLISPLQINVPIKTWFNRIQHLSAQLAADLLRTHLHHRRECTMHSQMHFAPLLHSHSLIISVVRDTNQARTQSAPAQCVRHHALCVLRDRRTRCPLRLSLRAPVQHQKLLNALSSHQFMWVSKNSWKAYDAEWTLTHSLREFKIFWFSFPYKHPVRSDSYEN